MPDMDNWILALASSQAYAQSVITGIGDVKINSTHDGLLFTNKGDGSSFEVILPGFHTHSNLSTILEKFTKDANGNLLFDGEQIVTYEDLVAGKNIKIEKDATTGKITISSTGSGSSGSGGELGQDITSSIAVGGISANTKFTQGTSYDDMWNALLNPYQKPIINTFTLTSNITPNASVYEIGTLITSLVLSASITKKSKPLTFVKFYEGSTVLNTQTGAAVANGGTFSYTHTLNNDDTDTTYKVECSDGDNTVNKTATIKFARNTFYGTDSATTSPYTTSAEVRALTGKKLGAKAGDTFSVSIPVGSKKVVIAIPSTLNISSIKYVEGLNAEVKSVFSIGTVNVEGNNNYTGIDYKVYEYAPASPFSAVCTYNVTL